MIEVHREPKHVFKGVFIPAEIWESDQLTWMEKCLIAEVDALDDGDGCFASNEWLASKFKTSPSSMANQLSKLRKMGIIKDISFDGRRRKIRIDLGFIHGLNQGSPGSEPCINSEVTACIESKEESKEETNTRLRRAKATLEEIQAFCAEEKLPESDAIAIFNKWEGNGWTNGGKAIRNWQATIRSWRAYGYLPSQKQSPRSNSKPQRQLGAYAKNHYDNGF